MQTGACVPGWTSSDVCSSSVGHDEVERYAWLRREQAEDVCKMGREVWIW